MNFVLLSKTIRETSTEIFQPLFISPPFKGIVSRDFEGLQIILIIRLCVPDVPLEIYSF